MTSLPWLSVIGINENGSADLCGEARDLISQAVLVAGGRRHLELARDMIRGETLEWPSPPHHAIPAIMAKRPGPVCVLCSGDPFHYGMGAVLVRHIPVDEMRVFPAPSIFSLVAAKLGWALQHTVTIGLNGRPVEKIIPHLQPGARIIALSADEKTPRAIAALLAGRGLGKSRISVMEHVGGTQERIRSGDAEVFAVPPPVGGRLGGGQSCAIEQTCPHPNPPPNGEGDFQIARLNCVAIEIPDDADTKSLCLPIASGLADDWFAHDGQMTKREVRAVTLAALAPQRGELLWDIGLGSGSIAIEWLLASPANRAIGFEKHSERAVRAAANAKALGVPQLIVMEGEAPVIFEGLEAPDAIFIGGGASAPGMMDAAWMVLKPGGRLVMNAISLETEALMLAAYKRYGGALTRIGIERADPVGSMTGWRPAMTVTQWSITK